MASTSRDETTKRLNRLAGSGRGSGGGLPLPGLFSAMLSEVLDNEPVSTERMTEIASSVLSFKEQAVFATWPTWDALTADVLAQMESRNVVQQKGGSWARGPKLVTGQRIEIIPARPNIGSKSDGVTVWTRDVREARSSADHAIRTFGELDAEVAQRGNRRVTTARKELILESMRQLGDLRDWFPVLLDEQGNVVDGRHRREIDPTWPAHQRKVPLDRRLAAAAAANRTSAWSGPDWKALLERVTEATGKKTEAVRTLIRLALLEDATRSDRAISALVGCSHHTVTAVRADLQSAGQIAQQRAVNQHAHRDTAPAEPAIPRTVPKETEEALTQEARRRLEAGEPTDFRGLARQFGTGEAYVQQRIAVAKALIQQAEQQPYGSARPETSASAPSSPVPRRPSTRISPASLMQRIGRLLKRWESDSDDPADSASELEELEALRREIDERIEALRR